MSRRHVSRGSRRPERTASGDIERAIYIALISFVIALSGFLAHGAAYAALPKPLERGHTVIRPANSVYHRALVLSSQYDSRPYWHGAKLIAGAPANRATADLAIEHLIPCESGGRTVDRLDTNGKMSYGILQFQDWPEWERMSRIYGDPDNPDDAIRMAEWGIEHGLIDRWTCARVLGEI